LRPLHERAPQLEDPVVGARAQLHLLDRSAHETLAGFTVNGLLPRALSILAGLADCQGLGRRGSKTASATFESAVAAVSVWHLECIMIDSKQCMHYTVNSECMWDFGGYWG
jgi:hypothetical protein